MMENLDKYIDNRKEEDAGVKHGVPSGAQSGSEKREGKSEAEDTDNPKNSSSSMMLGLLEEFTKIYSDRLQRVEETAKNEGKEYLQNKVSVLESWVRDLGEQNAVLVATVEELEREAAERVALLEDRLTKMAATTRQSCVSLRDHQIQVSSLVSDKIGLENETKELEEKILALERRNSRLIEENSGLHSDINSLTQVIARARGTGQWETDDLTFSFITPEQLFGPVLSSSRQSSPPLKESQHDYFQPLSDEPIKKDHSSAASSISNIQDMEISAYGGRNSEKTLLIMKLRADLQNLQSLNEDANSQLLERDKQIADLQSQLTEMLQKMSARHSEAGNQSHTLQELQHHRKHDKVEMTYNEEIIHNILSKKSSAKNETSKDVTLSLWKSYPLTGVHNETQLNENTDVLVSRLAELENECQHLRIQHKALQDSHNLCTPTISMLKEQLNRSHQTQVELRTVLTAEVAQRHDQLIALHDEHKEYEQKHHETLMQLQLKTEIIKDLRKEIKLLKENLEAFEKSDLTPVRESSNLRESKCAETQTSETVITCNETPEEEASGASSGCYSSLSQSSQISKLENELAEKSILLRELQSHLASSRQELHLKDETLYKLEQKLDSSRREGGEKGDRMDYLTGQLTNLQLEVGRTHGQAEQLRRQASEQRLTISALQDALVSSKRSCDELRSRVNSDYSSWGSEAVRLEHDLREAQALQHHTYSQLVECGARGEVLREENHALSRRVALLEEAQVHSPHLHHWKVQTEEATRNLMQAKKEADMASKDREQLTRQLQEADRQRQDLVTSLQLLQGQVQALEEDVRAATAARTEAERKADEAWRKSLHLQERLSAQETSESVERLGRQLEETVAALTTTRDEARIKTEQLRRAQLDIEQLNDALGYEKDLNTSLHDQVEALVKEVAAHEDKVEGLKKEVRRQAREASQMEKKFSASESQAEELRRQVRTLEGLLQEEQQEVVVLQESLTQESKLLKETRAKVDQAKKEVARGEEKSTGLKRDLQDAKDKIVRLENRIHEMEGERETEVALVAERLTAAHEESVRRLEESLVAYTRVQDHDHFQVEGLEESLAEVGSRLAEAELQLKDAQQERDALGRSLRQERAGREEEAKEHQRQMFRLSEENSLLKARLESVQEETAVWQRQCEDLEQRHALSGAASTTTPNSSLLTQLARAQRQVEELKEEVREARQEKRSAEEEKTHAHEQVLSLIRECNALEEQIHRLTKDKCRLEEQVSGREADLTMARDSTRALKEDLALKTEHITHIENELCMLKKTLEAGEAGETVRREASEVRRLLLERDTQARVAQLKLTTLQRSLQEKQSEVSLLEEKLQEAHMEVSKNESEVGELKAQVAMLKAQLSHVHSPKISHQPTSDKVEALEERMSHMRGELAAKEEHLIQAREGEAREACRAKSLLQEVARLNKGREEAIRQVMVLEASLTETREGIEASQSMGRLWETQVANIEKEVARLLCETNQLKDCNAALHNQLSSSQAETEALREHMRAKENQVEELQQARDLLASDAQVVVAAVRQWLHEQKVTNTKLAGKLHQQNKQILLLNTEKQFLAERNTSLQRSNHDLTLQVHDLRARLGLPLTPNTPEKLGKVGGVMVTGFASPRVMSPTLGTPPSRGTAHPVAAAHPPVPDSDAKFDDFMSTCSSEGSANGCLVPGPDLPGAAQLDRLAQLADSLLAASRNISRASGCLLEAHGTGKLTTATSLGDLTSVGAWDHRKSLGSKRTSASVGNLTALFPLDLREKTAYSISKLGSRMSPVPWSGRGGEVIVAAPVRERKGSHRFFSSHSIEEVDEEDMSRCEAVSRAPSCSTTRLNVQGTPQAPMSSKATQNNEASSSQQTWSEAKTTNTNSRTTTASQTVQFPPTNEYPSRLSRGTSA
ncbi:centrosome-associated protein CEP250-like isoform X4 [Eriocheir sinensis]|uniref:centrosome-associated protein CEP250-like isoform X4 n=1 Tax=Eriocheir sinensis TaxID=95602 RepID=UPI0021CABA32|nr:centrosome-associated protein CEP250-like isoform X4 [Eriocheir sinensis]